MRVGAKFGLVLIASGVPAWGQETVGKAIGWTWPLYIILPLVVVALLYAIGVVKMTRHGSRVRLWPVLCFVLGWGSLVLALDSPIHEISEQLFWVHMTQHEIQ